MSLKEIRAHLKKAKAAIDKQDFQEAKRCCQVCEKCFIYEAIACRDVV